jgi:MFS family permease
VALVSIDVARASSPVSPSGPTRRHQARWGALGSTIGTTIEWYDFFLYSTAATLIFPALFFPGSSAYAGRLEAFATYAVGFAARPVGAALFGHWGDRIGRKATLIVSLLLMGVSTTLLGLLPGTASIGIWAPVGLVLLRLVQGIAVGGEFGGAVLLSMEWGDQRRRGLTAAIPGLGAGFGLILGTGFFSLLELLLTDGQFHSWGWRIPFLFSAVMTLAGLFIRMRILETPMFLRRLEQHQVSRMPTIDVVRHHGRPIVLCALTRISSQATFYVITAFALGYMTHDRGYGGGFALAAIMAAAAVSLVVAPLAGHLSDRIGRKRVVRIGAVLTAVYGFVLFAAIDSRHAWLAFAVILFALVPLQLQESPQASMIAESFPTSVRYAGSGLAYQLTSVIGGGPAPLVATWLLATTGSAYAVAAVVVLWSVITLVAISFVTDHSGSDIDDDATYRRGPRPRSRARASLR